MIPLLKARYQDRDVLKENGAKWDTQARRWYVPDGTDPKELAEFMDSQTKAMYEMMFAHFQTLSKETEMEALLKKSQYSKPAGFRASTYPNLGLPSDFVVVDTETTGLGQDDEVVEMSVLDAGGMELYHGFFNPGKQIVPEAQAVTGLSNEMLVGMPSFASEWPKITGIIGDRRIAGHNIGYDKRIIEQTLSKQVANFDVQSVENMFADSIDSMKIAIEKGVPKGLRSLGKICAAIGVKQAPNHRSSHDCLGVLYALQAFEHDAYPLIADQQASSGRSREGTQLSIF